MGFYLEDERKIKKYISDSYMKNYLLGSNSISIKIFNSFSKTTDTENEEIIFKKLNIKIPVVSLNDLADLLQDNIKSDTIDDNTLFLFLKKEPLMAYLYLLKDGRAFPSFERDLLSGSIFNTRSDTLISNLNHKEESLVDIFAPLRSQLIKFSNYNNPYEASEEKINTLYSSRVTLIQPTFQNLNYGNIFYSMNANSNPRVKTLYKYMMSDGNPLLSSTLTSTYPLPLASDVTGFIYLNSGVENFARAKQISEWAVIGFILVFYGVSPIGIQLAAIYALSLFWGWNTNKIFRLFMDITGRGAIWEFDDARPAIGLNNWLASTHLFENFLAYSRSLRLDFSKIDAIFKTAYKISEYNFNNRLGYTESEYTTTDNVIDDLVARAYSQNPSWYDIFHRIATPEREEGTIISPDNLDWYGNMFDELYTGTSENKYADGSYLYDKQTWFNFDYVKNTPTFKWNEGEETDDPAFFGKASTAFCQEEVDYMISPISKLVSSGKEPLSNDWLARNLLHVNYSYLNGLNYVNEEDPTYLKNSKDCRFLLHNNILIGNWETSEFFKDDNEDLIPIIKILNFGNTPFANTVRKVIDYVTNNIKNTNEDVTQIRNTVKSARAIVSVENASKFIKNTMKKNVFNEEEYPYIGLARTIVLNYLDWLLDDNATEPDTITEYIFSFKDPFIYKYYKFCFYMRQTIFNLPKAVSLVIKNATFSQLFSDPVGGNNALVAILEYINKYKYNVFAEMFANPLIWQSSQLLANMTSGIMTMGSV